MKRVRFEESSLEKSPKKSFKRPKRTLSEAQDEWYADRRNALADAAVCPPASVTAWNHLYSFGMESYDDNRLTPAVQHVVLEVLLQAVTCHDDYRGLEDFVSTSGGLQRRLTRRMLIRYIVRHQSQSNLAVQAARLSRPARHLAELLANVDCMAALQEENEESSDDDSSNSNSIIIEDLEEPTSTRLLLQCETPSGVPLAAT